MPQPKYRLTDIMVFETEAEAREYGCRVRAGHMVTPDGRRAITVYAFRGVDGMRVTSYDATERAVAHPWYEKLAQVLDRSVTKTGPTVDTLHVYVDTQIKTRWSYVARNGRVLADSGQGYSDIQSARHGFSIVNRAVLSKDPNYQLEGCDRHDRNCLVWEIRRAEGGEDR